MKKRKARNRLLLLIQERERQIGRRVRQRDIARHVGVADHTIMSWIRNEVTRFDSIMLEGLCDFFDCELGDLLYFEWVEDESESQTDTAKKGDD
jgi:DNA-binding Xre family transcriptional regulator